MSRKLADRGRPCLGQFDMTMPDSDELEWICEKQLAETGRCTCGFHKPPPVSRPSVGMTILEFAEPMGGARPLFDAWGCTCPNCYRKNGLLLRRMTDGEPFFIALCGCTNHAIREARARLVETKKVVKLERRRGAGSISRLVAARPD